jgi:hypothetical protein
MQVVLPALFLLGFCHGLGCKDGNGVPGNCIDPNAATCNSGLTAQSGDCLADGSGVQNNEASPNI